MWEERLKKEVETPRVDEPSVLRQQVIVDIVFSCRVKCSWQNWWLSPQKNSPSLKNSRLKEKKKKKKLYYVNYNQGLFVNVTLPIKPHPSPVTLWRNVHRVLDWSVVRELGIVFFVLEHTQNKRGSYVSVCTHQGEAWAWCMGFKRH